MTGWPGHERPPGTAEEELHLARARATSRRNLSLFWTGVASMYLTWGVMGEGAAAWTLFVVLAVVAAYSWKGFAARRREQEEAAGRLRGLDSPEPRTHERPDRREDGRGA